MPARMAGVPTTAAVVAAASRPAQIRRARVNMSAPPQSMKLKVMPAWTTADPPTSTAVVAAASKPAENRQARVSIFGSFRGGDLPPPLLPVRGPGADHPAALVAPNTGHDQATTDPGAGNHRTGGRPACRHCGGCGS